MLQRSVVEREDATAKSRCRTPFLYVEARGEEQVLLAGTCRHLLVRTPTGFAIRQKRVDLLNAGQRAAGHPVVHLSESLIHSNPPGATT